LVITGHGAGLRVHHGALVVRDGFTHYPQKLSEYRFFPKDPSLPSRIIVLDGSGNITFDALEWLARQNLPLVRVNWRGEIQSVIGNSSYAADPRKVAQQLEWKRSGRSLEIACGLIQQKVTNSIATLREYFSPSPKRREAIGKLQAIEQSFATNRPRNVTVLLSREGQAAIAYFDVWQSTPLDWKGVGRKPIPKDWHQVGFRSSHARKRIENRNASHPVNAMLNYAYALLHSEIQIRTISAGYDPTIGVLHANVPDRPALVLDLMEPLRPVVDRSILRLIREHAFEPGDFTIRLDGVCRLNPGMARKVTAEVLPRLWLSTRVFEPFQDAENIGGVLR
jgi:CRISPR-associated endonuclease Cas1